MKKVGVIAVASLLLSGCVAPPVLPSIAALPGPGKSFERFNADEAQCEGYASARIAPAVESANNQAAANLLLGTVVGGALGAGVGAAFHNAGAGAAIGAASGTAYGAAPATWASAGNQGLVQHQYDIAFAQCMIAQGDVFR